MKNSNIPWIGEIPNDWEVQKLRRSVEVSSDKTAYNNEIYIGLENIQPNGGNYVEVEEQHIEGVSTLFHKNDVLFGKLRPYLIKCIIAKFGGLCSSELLVLRNFIGDNRFLRYTLISPNTIETITSSTYGTKMPRASWSFIGNMEIPLPPLKTQQKIADFLDSKCSKIDSTIEQEKEHISKLKEYRQSLITEAVTKGLNKNAPMKDSGIEWIGEIPQGWETGKMLYALAMPITDGPHETPQLYDDGIPFLSAEAIKKGKLDFNLKRGYISDEFYKECCKKYIPQVNDIYMIKSGATTGNIAIVETSEKFQIWSPLAVFRCAGNTFHKYLYWLLSSNCIQKQIQLNWSYGTQQNIGMRVLEKLTSIFPPLDEQKQIADYLDTKTAQIDNAIAKKESLISKLQEYKKSLIFEAVTGKMEI